MNISLMFFPYGKIYDKCQYQLMQEAALFADKNNFTAIWMPERHFHPFGGLYPNPAITSAALSTITKNIHLRAGSVISPIHDIIRIAEEWSVVDNLSNGRIGLSFASGWHENDFVFYPDNYINRYSVMSEQIKIFNAAWAGGKVLRKNGKNELIEIELWPKPYKKDVPIWLSVASNPEGFVSAGSLGYGVLTHLINQDISALKKNIQLYNNALANNGLTSKTSRVTLMLHTYINNDKINLYKDVEKTFKIYLRNVAKFGGVKASNTARSATINIDLQEQMLDVAYKRYLNSASLIGTTEQCLSYIKDLIEIGVNEIAALVDFGLPHKKVFQSLILLNNIRKQLCYIED